MTKVSVGFVAIVLLGCLPHIEGQLTVQNIRLGGGDQRTYGRVEVQVNGQWGTVCDDQWDDIDASVVCKMLGFNQGGVGFQNARFGQGQGPIWLDDVNCLGNEQRIDQCQQNPSLTSKSCSHAEDAGVNCTQNAGAVTQNPLLTTTRGSGVQPGNCTQPSNSVRLIAPNGITGMGMVEVLNNGQWGAVCDDLWDELDARVVCNSLCFPSNEARPGAPADVITSTTTPIILDDVQCVGNEARLQDCPHAPWNQHNCAPTEKASVTCVKLTYKPPDPPVPNLQCRDGYLIAAFNRSYDRNLEEKHLTIANPYAGACNVQQATDTQFVTIRIPFTQCGTQVEQNATHLIYSNVVKYDHTSQDGFITRVNVFRIGVRCEMIRTANTSKEEIPLTESVTQSAPGRFVITMKFYRNDGFTVEDPQTPLRLPIGEWLNVALEMEAIDSRLKLVVPNCRATPFNNQSNVQYPLFERNCRNEPSLATFPLNQQKFGFRYQTFMFINADSVFINCDAFVCLVSDDTSVCDRSCNNSKAEPVTPSTTPAGTTSSIRRKRDVSEPFVPEYYDVTSGPVKLYRRQDTETILERVKPGSGSVTITMPTTSKKVTTSRLSNTTPSSKPSPTATSLSSTKAPAQHTTTKSPVTSKSRTPTTTMTTTTTTTPGNNVHTTTKVLTTKRTTTPAPKTPKFTFNWAFGITTTSPSTPARPTTAAESFEIIRNKNSIAATERSSSQNNNNQKVTSQKDQNLQKERLILTPILSRAAVLSWSLLLVSACLIVLSYLL